MKAFFQWINDRTGFGDAWRSYADSPLPGGASWLGTLPAVLGFVFSVQAITGFFLWMYYSPGTQTAWESVYFLQYQVFAGRWLRAIHHFSGQTTFVLACLYLLSLIFSGRYRARRETIYWTVLLMVLCSLGLLLTGDLLSWCQNGYAGTKVRTNFSTLVPWIGDSIHKLLLGGPSFGHLTLTRFLALHIGLFGGGFCLLLIFHGYFDRRTNRRLAENAASVAPFWPRQAARNVFVCLIVFVAIGFLAFWLGGVELGSPADLDPSHSFDAARPEWVFRGLYQFTHYFSGEKAAIAIFVVPGVLLLLYFLLPFFGKTKLFDVLNRTATAILFLAIAALTSLSYYQDYRDPKYKNAWAEERFRARRTIELAEFNGIPPAGALELLRNDGMANARWLFKQHCAVCHNALDANGDGVGADESSAPNLHGFAKREWIAGLLDPQKICSSQYYGDTNIRGGMIDFVKSELPEMIEDDASKKNLEKAIMALSAEAELLSQHEMDQRDKQAIEEGRQFLVEEFNCVECHKFRDQGAFGTAPDLTGYGSKAWIEAFTADPKSKRFYGKKNDRMPSYAESDDSQKNLLSSHELEIISQWLRGESFDKQEQPVRSQ
jgi:ubiquinol-cytochrome c reductase cytochrome b subunit